MLPSILPIPVSRAAMQLFILSLFILTLSAKAQDRWTTDFSAAKEKALKENKCILLNFSGSDWCGPCIKMKQDILSSDDFLKYADKHLVLVNADFPRMKKNKQDKSLEEQNGKLADQYNKNGLFPYTVLLNKDLKILKVWDGYPRITRNEFSTPPKQFTDDIEDAINSNAH